MLTSNLFYVLFLIANYLVFLKQANYDAMTLVSLIRSDGETLRRNRQDVGGK